jgi:hypothetical protein
MDQNRVNCKAFIRRIRPQGVSVLCGAPAEIETWAIGPEGQEVFHVARCRKHPDTARYSTSEPGWRIEYREVKKP